MGKGGNQSRGRQVQEYAEKRMKSRIEVFLQNEIKNKQEIIGPEMVTHYLKDKFDEYQRKPI